MKLPDPCKYADEEVARNLMVSYLAGTYSPAGEMDFEAHYLSCDECCSTLAILLLAHSPNSEEEDKALAALGVKAARKARAVQKGKARRPPRVDSRVASERPLRVS